LGDDTHVPAATRNYRVASNAIASIASVVTRVAATTAAARRNVGSRSSCRIRTMTPTPQHGTTDGRPGWVFSTNLRTSGGRLIRRLVRQHSRQFGLFWRVFAVNGIILGIAFALLVLTPITVSSPTTRDQLVVLSAGLVVMLVANAALLRFSLTPLRRLADQMETVDVLDPGERLETGGTAEVATVIEAFNAALDRLADERRASTRRVLFAQEAERRRIAQELHDQIGQDLTAVVLELKRVQTRVTPEEAETLADAQELARESLEDLRRISHQLRPVALDDLGLSSAIAALCADITRRTGFQIDFAGADGALPAIDHDTELAIYRVAQESITNAVRHSGGTRVEVSLTADGGGLVLHVADDGSGFEPPPRGGGIRGMRERALAIGGRLTVGTENGGGAVTLRVPNGPGAVR
jgi:two-component system, NarL family, sensor histidine kinase UhpB